MFADYPVDLIRNDKCHVLQVPLLSYEIPQNHYSVNGILHRDASYCACVEKCVYKKSAMIRPKCRLHTAHGFDIEVKGCSVESDSLSTRL